MQASPNKDSEEVSPLKIPEIQIGKITSGRTKFLMSLESPHIFSSGFQLGGPAISSDRMQLVNNTLGFNKHHHTGQGIYKLEQSVDLPAPTTKRVRTKEKQDLKKSQPQPDPRQDIQTSYNMRFMSLSQGLRQNILPSKFS